MGEPPRSLGRILGMSPSSDRFLITGCASGIGRHLADTLLDRGAHVVATDINEDALTSHAEKAGWPEERVRLERLGRPSRDAVSGGCR